ncbi:MAG: pyridoxamine 5'-phosphate oxidase family protein [Thermomicrobiales bacterium]
MLDPIATLDRRYSDATAEPAPWADAVAILDTAEIFWLSTVRAEGGPHVTPLIAVWVDDALWFATGAQEQKARNLAAQPRVAITTGCNAYASGIDLVLEGIAEIVHDEPLLQRVADRYASKYGWQFTVRDGAFVDDEDRPALVFRVRPAVAYGFAKGTFGQTRWTF